MASYLDKDGLKAVWSRVVTQTYDQANAQIHEFILNSIYPIGSIYIDAAPSDDDKDSSSTGGGRDSQAGVSPASLIGGTWLLLNPKFPFTETRDKNPETMPIVIQQDCSVWMRMA